MINLCYMPKYYTRDRFRCFFAFFFVWTTSDGSKWVHIPRLCWEWCTLFAILFVYAPLCSICCDAIRLSPNLTMIVSGEPFCWYARLVSSHHIRYSSTRSVHSTRNDIPPSVPTHNNHHRIQVVDAISMLEIEVAIPAFGRENWIGHYFGMSIALSVYYMVLCLSEISARDSCCDISSFKYIWWLLCS